MSRWRFRRAAVSGPGMSALLLFLGGCAELTAYRQTTLAPVSEPPVTVGAPIGNGVLAGAFDLDAYASEGYDPVGVAGDPALDTPFLGVGGHARIGLGNWCELGVDGAYTPREWTRETGVGVLDIPGDAGLWGVGGHATFGWRAPHWGIGLTLDGRTWHSPYAQYSYSGPGWAQDAYTDGDAAGAYTLDRTGVATPFRLMAATGGSVRFGVFDGAFGFAFSPEFSNVGFSEDPQPPFHTSGLSVLPTLEAGVLVGPLRVGTSLWWASGASTATNGASSGFGGRLSAELRTQLWGRPRGDTYHEAPL